MHHPPKERGRFFNWPLALIIVVAALLRFGLWQRLSHNPPLLIQGDGGGYVQIARNLVEGNGFSMDTGLPYAPDMIRTPGYPFLIYGIYRVFGYRPEIVTLIQNVLSLVNVCLVYLLAKKLFGVRAGWIAAALMAVDVGAIILANVTLTETLFILLMLAATCCLFEGLSAPRGAGWMAGAGLLFGAATLTRPVGLYVFLILLPFVLWATRLPWRERLVRIVVLVVVFALPVLPWSVRNLRTFGSPQLSLAGDLTIAYHAKYLRSTRNHTTLEQEETSFHNEVIQALGGREVGPAELNRLYRSKAIDEIRRHPVGYATLYARSIGLMLLLPNTNFLANTLGILDHSTGIIADMRTRSVSENVHALTDFVAQFLVGSPDRVLFFVALVVEVLVTLLAYVLALFGIVTGWKQHRATIVLLLVMIGAFLVVTGPIGTGRYRLPAMPYVMILSGSGWVQLRSWCRIRRSPDPGPAKTAA